MFGKRSAQRTDDVAIGAHAPKAYAEPRRPDVVDSFLPPELVYAAAPPVPPKPEEARHYKNNILAALYEAIDPTQLYRLAKEDAAREIKDIVAEAVTIRGLRLSTAEQAQISREICDELLGFGPLEPLLSRDDIGDIMVNGTSPVFIETNGLIEPTHIAFRDDQQLLNVCQRLAAQTGRHVDQSSPICDARLEDGSRINIILPPLSVHGPSLTIRKFKRDRLRLRDLVSFGTINPAGARLLAIIAACQCNVLVSGGTGSGKTTLLNCLTAFINPRERIITCEDTAELLLQQPHVVSLETRPANIEGRGAVNMTELVRNCLRMRPERIIVGEVRGAEAMDLLQAMNTGHDGSMGTLHANTPRDALSRFESMIMMSGMNLPTDTLRKMMCSAIDIIVQTSRLRDGSRRITEITEVLSLDNGVFVTQDLLKFEIQGETASGKIIGEHISSGIARPRFFDQARYFGLEERLLEALIELGAPDFRPVQKNVA